jgi:pimeloyl-ACP methyl ester carboxylesterase
VTDFTREMRDRRVQGNGVELWCIEWHPSRSDGSRPVLLLHGMSSNARFWGRVAAKLSRRQVLALGLRGHGQSDRPESGYTVEAMATDVAHVLWDLALDGVVVVGHSWGAAVALQLAVIEPASVSRLVLVDGPIASSIGYMGFAEADREMRPPARCYASPEEIETDARRFLRDARGDDLQAFARASFTWTPQGWCPVLSEAGRMEMVRSLYAFRPDVACHEEGTSPLPLTWDRGRALPMRRWISF